MLIAGHPTSFFRLKITKIGGFVGVLVNVATREKEKRRGQLCVRCCDVTFFVPIYKTYTVLREKIRWAWPLH